MSDWIPRLMAEKVQLEQRIAIVGAENLHLRNKLSDALRLLQWAVEFNCLDHDAPMMKQINELLESNP